MWAQVKVRKCSSREKMGFYQRHKESGCNNLYVETITNEPILKGIGITIGTGWNLKLMSLFLRFSLDQSSLNSKCYLTRIKIRSRSEMPMFVQGNSYCSKNMSLLVIQLSFYGYHVPIDKMNARNYNPFVPSERYDFSCHKREDKPGLW
jgi:hypothetical protein